MSNFTRELTAQKGIVIWGFFLPTEFLQSEQINYLKKINSASCPSVNWIWSEMDRVWDEAGLDNSKKLHNQDVANFYSHPIWIANGIFSATDAISIKHRNSISLQVRRFGAQRIADYGGGFGQLALMLHETNPNLKIDIIEPYPSQLGIKRVEKLSKIRFIQQFEGQYECVIAQDVLEHVEQPIELLTQMVKSTKKGGHLIFANCFYPVIKCHLPSTFYLRHTFTWVAFGMGLKFIGTVDGAKHAQVFKRVGEISEGRVVLIVGIAKVLGLFINFVMSIKVNILTKFKVGK